MRLMTSSLLALLLALAPVRPTAAGEARLRLLAAGPDAPAPRQATLDAIGLRDVADNSQWGSPATAADASVAGSGLRADPGPVPMVALNLHVRRQLPVRWQLELPTDRRHAPPNVRVECHTHDGRAGALASVEDPDHLLSVRVESSGMRVAARDATYELLEGDIWMEFDLGSAAGAGRYEGRITVDMEYL